jgi:beta-phosphoglucomutase-like phosphatase (HAD superfamily)
VTAATALATEPELRKFLRTHGPFTIAVWDFDGVLGDTEPAQAEAYREMLAERGIAAEHDFFNELAGGSEREIWAALQTRHGFTGDFAALRRERIARVTPVLATSVAPNWFVRRGIAALRQDGTRSVIISSGNREVVEAYVDAWRLRSLFDEISAASGREDDIPKPQRLRSAIAAERALVVEDSAKYLRLASDLGAATLGVVHSLSGALAEVADAVMTSRMESTA